ncbi:hypothetical protein COB52_02100 [Candidatus Kaiserbacteria bacterium]|nr:MAG: hypothetical protein COB52_02100 [Candidatus Kaiserbacteria bacterium]
MVSAGAAITNFNSNNIPVAISEASLVVFLALTIFLAAKGKFVNTLGSIISYLGGFLLLFIITQITGADPSPYAGLVGLLLIVYVLAANRQFFAIHAAIMYLAFVSISIFGFVDLDTAVSIKFQMIYGALAAMIYIHKKYSDERGSELFKYAEKAQQNAKTIEDRAFLSAVEMDQNKTKSVEVDKTNRELSLQKDKLEKMNKLMMGRELKMVELKKEIKALKGNI